MSRGIRYVFIGALVALCGLGPNTSAGWQIAEKPCLSKLYDQADFVVMGQVIDKQSRRGNLVDVWVRHTRKGTSRDVNEYEFPLTDYVVKASRTFKQTVNGSTVRFTSRGGELEDGSKQIYFAEYDLALGDEVLLFLRWDADNQWYESRSAAFGTFVLAQASREESPVYSWLLTGEATRDDDGCSAPDVGPEGLSREEVLVKLSQFQGH